MLVIAISGACRSCEILNLKLENIKVNDDNIIINITETKNSIERTFLVTNNICTINFITLFKKYLSLRPPHVNHSRFFLSYKQQKCTVQPIGINTIAKIPSIIAKYLAKPEPHNFTGHCFRRTSATLLVNEGGDLIQLKKHGGWKSTKVAEGYVDKSTVLQRSTANLILQGQHQSTASTSLTSDTAINLNKSNVLTGNHPMISISDNCNVTINIYNNNSLNDNN